MSIVALKDNQIRVVQASMLGSILSNILLVLGCCFLAGGLRYHEQSFNSTVASTMSSLMAVASASLIIPATLFAALSSSYDSDSETTRNNILFLSRGTSIILLALYVMYLYFQLRSHNDLFEDVHAEECPSEELGEEHQEETHILNPFAAGIALIVVTILVAVCAEYLVGSIEGIVERTGMSRTFIGLVLIPIVGNAAEHVTAIVVAYKNKMDLAIGVAIGSSLQIALFVTPFLVILGWILNVEMTLHFHIFETMAFFISGLVVTLLIQDGKSNYLEGGLCLGMYVFIIPVVLPLLTNFFAPGTSFLPLPSMFTRMMCLSSSVCTAVLIRFSNCRSFSPFDYVLWHDQLGCTCRPETNHRSFLFVYFDLGYSRYFQSLRYPWVASLHLARLELVTPEWI